MRCDLCPGSLVAVLVPEISALREHNCLFQTGVGSCKTKMDTGKDIITTDAASFKCISKAKI